MELIQTSAAAQIKTARSKIEGFTLLELLVVVTILGIIATFAFSRLRIDQPGLVLQNEAEQFASRVGLARDEAVIVGQPLALFIEAQRYGFARPMRTEASAIEWLPIDRPRALGSHTLSGEQVNLVLRIRGARQSLAQAGGLQPRIKVMPTGEVTPFELGFRRSDTTDVEQWVLVSSQGEIDVTVNR